MYAKVYQNIIHEEFRTLQDKVMYLDCMDMTIADENDNIHASDTVEQMMDQLFYHVCPYCLIETFHKVSINGLRKIGIYL